MVNDSYVKKEKIYPAYVSRRNSNCEKQVILLMILIEEKLSCRKKTVSIIKRNNYQALRWFLLSELPSLFRNRKKTWIE